MPKKPVARKISDYLDRLIKSGEDRTQIIEAMRVSLSAIRDDNSFNLETADEICERMALGETLTKILKDKHMPSDRQVFNWRHDHPEFLQQYARARVEQMQAWADEIIHLVDDAETGRRVQVPLESEDLEKIESEGFVTFKFRKDFLYHATAKAHERKWIMSKVDPDSFGDKLQVAQTVTFEDKEDAELLDELRTAAEKARVTPEMLVQFLGGEEKAVQ